MKTTVTTAADMTITTAVASSQALPGLPADLPSSPEDNPASSSTDVTINDNNNPRKSVILKSLQSMIGGGSFRTDYTVGQLSLSNTINVSARSKMDMSIFQTKKNGSWAIRGVTLVTDNLSYFVEKQKGSWWSRHLVANAKTTTTPTPNTGTTTTAAPSTKSGSAPTRKALLKHVTMTVLPGEVAFVMGPSGAGKSTLLDALAGRIKNGIMSGHMYFNGRPRDASFYANSAYVRQDDVHIPNLTVEETLYFAARLRLGEEYTDTERRMRVNAVSDLLGLRTCLISMVGDAGIRGISGGQLKRLSIAVEIMNMPSLIFLDEPTSGLDSVMAHDVMTFTNRLADQNRTILATIHQPSSDTFALASKVILVTAGRVAFCGPASEAQAYFTSPRLGFSAATYTNPADFIIAVVSGAEVSTNLVIGAHNTDAKKLSELYESSAYFQAPLTNAPSTTDGGLTRLPQHFPTSTTDQTLTLIRRFWIAQSRQWEFVVAQLGKNIIVASVCGAIFFGQGREISTPTFTNVSFNVSSLWYFAMLYTVLSCLQIIPHLFFYKVLYTRERSANVYSTFAYWAANAIVSVPLLIVSHVVFVEISYWMVGLYPNASIHFFALFVTFLNNLISFYCAQYIAAVSPSAEVALAMFPLVFLFLGSFAGFTIPLGELPAGWKWASYISYPRWTYEALIINEFENRLDRAAVLAFYSFDRFDKYFSLPILCAFIVFTNVLVYVGLSPAQSKLRFEGPTSPGDSPKKEIIVVMEDPISPLSPTTLTLEDFKVRSAQRFPATAGLSLIFRDLQYSIGKSPERAARILKGVSGTVFPGQMCALMGGSGAGKSTLLDLLAYRKTGGYITGEYLIGGRTEKPASKWCSYVTQDSVHISLFTVQETLEYAALLRLDEKTSLQKRKERAVDVMKMLGLEDVADVLVGSSLLKGISGGQARRLSIGVEIMQLPDVIFLDEPTTGLDSQISHEVMSSVRNIANHNRTVVCTIHSPSEAVYNLFDSLLLLALGRQTYFGPVSDASAYFSQVELGWRMPMGKNPADFIMEANQGLLTGVDGSRRTIRELNQLFLSSANYTGIKNVIDKILLAKANQQQNERKQRNHGSEGHRTFQGRAAVAAVPLRIRGDSFMVTLLEPERYPRSTFAQMYILSHRQFRKAWKMKRDVFYSMLRNILVAVFHGSLYTNLSPGAIQSRLSLLFFAIMFVMMANQSFIPNVTDDRLLFYRERGAGVYGTVPYWFSSSLAYIPQCALASITYCTVVYKMSGLNAAAGAFGYFCLVVTMCGLCGMYFCQLVSLASPNSQIAVSVFPAALFLVVAFAGFVVRLPSLPDWLGSWAPIISFARWGFQGLVINEFKGNEKIDYYEIIQMQIPEPYQAFIENFGFEGYSKYDSLPILAICLAILWLATIIPIKFVSFEKR